MKGYVLAAALLLVAGSSGCTNRTGSVGDGVTSTPPSESLNVRGTLVARSAPPERLVGPYVESAAPTGSLQLAILFPANRWVLLENQMGKPDAVAEEPYLALPESSEVPLEIICRGPFSARSSDDGYGSDFNISYECPGLGLLRLRGHIGPTAASAERNELDQYILEATLGEEPAVQVLLSFEGGEWEMLQDRVNQ